MSKAFDNVNRSFLWNDLNSILEPDEIHILKVLVCNATLSVRNGDTIGNKFKTDIGVPQGDCLSTILFTLYLPRALKSPNRQNHESKCCDHSYDKHSNELKNMSGLNTAVSGIADDQNSNECKKSDLTIDQQICWWCSMGYNNYK